MPEFDFDFDTIINRRGTNSYKWDSASRDNVLPMWVADMDFRTAPAIIEAVQRRAAHGIFGYTRVPEEYYNAIIQWFARRHNWAVSADWIIYTSGVVPAISAIIKALTTPGDKVIIQTPVYNCFFSSIRNNGCEILENPLIYTNNTYVMDYDDLERNAADPKAKLLLLCNPHNPVGRVWTKDELLKLNTICKKHGVTVVADEIHCELVFPEYRYTPFASINKDCDNNSITCNSPSKAFNIAGLQIANIIASDKNIRTRINRAININEVCDVNPFGVEALIAAYTQGQKWLDALIKYIQGNYLCLKTFFETHLPQCPVVTLEGTYLVWVDCRALGLSSETLEHELLQKSALWLNAGNMYADDNFIRINIACPRSVMLDGLNRFASYISRLK